MERKTVECCGKLPQSLAQTFKEKTINKIKTKIVAENEDFIPQYKTDGAACCDLKAFCPNGDMFIGIGETAKIDCGFKMQMPAGYEAQIRSRSGLASKGIFVTNGIGTIDSDFVGNLCVLLTNLSKEVFVVKCRDRIAQMAVKPIYYFDFEEVNCLDETDRNEGGFGSTGI
jgi:dUTP pyrophosphatase